MRRPSHSFTIKALLAVVPMACLCLQQLAQAYVDLAPTLTRTISESPRISLVEVVEFDRQAHTVTLKEVRPFKGAPSPTTLTVRHDVGTDGGSTVARPILQWATPGARAVMFSASRTSLVCYGEGWYQVDNRGGTYHLGKERPDLPLAYYGSLSRLTSAVELLLANKPAVITVVAFGADNEGASFDLALNRQSMPGVVRIQRIRAEMSMPGNVAGASNNPAYFIGLGEVDESDIPMLVDQLKSADATTRAEGAEGLRSLGRKAADESPQLQALLNDSTPAVRFAAASALLKIAPRETQSLPVLQAGLASGDAAQRRAAARAAGFAGAAAEPLAPELAALLKDADESVRITALQAVSMLGPAASKAADAVRPFLENPETQIEAADALGRIGIAARPALKRLAQMLQSDQPTVRWAAVRAMAQIGGPDAHPAVDFMIKALPTANEVEGYNMMIYLSLLGPVARDALPTIQSTPIKNPVLPSATAWAMNADQYLPWQGGAGGRGGRGGRGGGGFGPAGGDVGGSNFPDGPQDFARGGGNQNQDGTQRGNNDRNQADAMDADFGGPGGRGGPGGGFGRGPGGPGGGGMGDIGTFIYQAYIHELGYRLAPAVPGLAKKIMDGTAGEIPSWGYGILAADPTAALAILTPPLSSNDLLTRERAIVAIGYMADGGAAAKPALEAVQTKSTDPREKKLVEWALRAIDGD